MKALVRLGATLGLVAGSMLGGVCLGNMPVFALSQEEVKGKLDVVPVYLITNKEGALLSRPLPPSQNNPNPSGSMTGVYMSPQEAESFIKELQSDPVLDAQTREMVKNLRVSATSLGEIYKQLQAANNQPGRLLFSLQPVEQEVKGAIELLRQSGQEVNQFSGVPVFAVRFSPEQGYVPGQITADNKDGIPLFFSKKDAQSFLTEVKPHFPKADIQVIDIYSVIKTLEDKNDAWLNKVVFIASQESLDYIRKQTVGTSENRNNRSSNQRR